jgi:hypothetical protein
LEVSFPGDFPLTLKPSDLPNPVSCQFLRKDVNDSQNGADHCP